MSVLHRLILKNVRLCQCGQSKKINSSYPLASQLLIINNDTSRGGQRQRCFSLQAFVESLAKTQTGIFKRISESAPVESCQNFLLKVHETTGLPWWATIICTTVLVRSCVTVPLALYQNNISAKLENIKMELDDIANELKKETSIAVKMYNWDEKTAKIRFRRSIKKQWSDLILRDNCHPFKTTILFWFQIPLWVSLSVSLRNLVYMLPKQDVDAILTFTELSVGGFGWIPNLVQVDSCLILPVSLGALSLAIVELQNLNRVNVPTKLQRYLTNLFRGVSILMVPVAASVPSCVVLYWTTSSAFGLVQNLVLMSPKLKRTFKIPQTPSELEHPYQHLILSLKHRLKSIPGSLKIF